MIGGKLVCLSVVVILIQGCYCLNSTQVTSETNATLATTPHIETIPTEGTTKKVEILPTTQNLNVIVKNSTNSTNLNQTNLEVNKIFHGEPNTTNATPTEPISVNFTSVTDSLNITSVNETSNDTISSNQTMTGAIASSDNIPPFRLPNWAAILAGVCLVSAVIGYFSCVSYRRFLQRKYGNSQILIGEDVYDTSDLRNFEI